MSKEGGHNNFTEMELSVMGSFSCHFLPVKDVLWIYLHTRKKMAKTTPTNAAGRSKNLQQPNQKDTVEVHGNKVPADMELISSILQ